MTTRVGDITLEVPRIRGDKFSTKLFAHYQRSEQALILALMEMVVNGVSTRKVTHITGSDLLFVKDESEVSLSLIKKGDRTTIPHWGHRISINTLFDS